MYRKNINRPVFSTLILGVYLLAALFSQNFHQHALSVFKSAHAVSNDQGFSKSAVADETSGCLWCHFLHTGNSEVPQEFICAFKSAQNVLPEIFSSGPSPIFHTISVVLLRGPPLDIV